MRPWIASASALAFAVSVSSGAQTAVGASPGLLPGPAEIGAMHRAIHALKSWRSVCTMKQSGVLSSGMMSTLVTTRVIRPDRVAVSITINGAATRESVKIGQTAYSRLGQDAWSREPKSFAGLRATVKSLAMGIDKGLVYGVAGHSSINGEPVSIYHVTMPSLLGVTPLGDGVQIHIGIGRGSMVVSTQSHLPLKSTMLLPMYETGPKGTTNHDSTEECKYSDYDGKDIEIDAPQLSGVD
jgi:hypothetical protein